ncbi:unnamed protein product [Didymodactylos carnosus]|uniref:Uncharacterized protein n=1 Tax=Didymodactylos carnosus TaxID=1234261 RepID=A0A814FQ03_9BILA|nr:unnamed protein product [Didymodactylos carnosus]CAF0987948.1 unnamed protein product [Didymodactylos carnosus]CAF3545759.1 unnamed protein product [Didymodactylos carnosus]CAF3760111.1 unnamed protein product [Didymodactylos carnosus]
MMVLLLLDGMSTIASLQNTHGQLFGIFTTFFHFRRLIKYQTESQERARILKRYEHHSIPSSIESLREKAAPLPPDRFDSLRSLPQQRSNIVLSPPPFCQSIRDDGTLIPRVATINRNPTMLIQRGLRQDGKPENFRYNIPLNELFHQIQTNEADQHHQQQENF